MRPLLAAALLIAALPAAAALKTGQTAPAFSAQASLGGNEFTFVLAEALKKGPVVLYFYPEAFTPGCTIEAHEFADATDDFKALGVTIIGVSPDPIAKLDKFSVEECRSKFAVAADADRKIETAYDAILPEDPKYANRTSFVIAPDGRIVYTYTDLDPDKHIENTMNAVKALQASAK
jgi:peroxiredoxin